MPAVTGFCLKVVLAIVVFLVGRRLIKWVLKIMSRSLEKANVDKGVIQFACSLGRIVLYALLIFNIAVSLGVTESSVAALLGTAGVTVGLALQGGLANVAGGVMILLFKPFLVGIILYRDSRTAVRELYIKLKSVTQHYFPLTIKNCDSKRNTLQ